MNTKCTISPKIYPWTNTDLKQLSQNNSTCNVKNYLSSNERGCGNKIKKKDKMKEAFKIRRDLIVNRLNYIDNMNIFALNWKLIIIVYFLKSFDQSF